MQVCHNAETQSDSQELLFAEWPDGVALSAKTKVWSAQAGQAFVFVPAAVQSWPRLLGLGLEQARAQEYLDYMRIEMGASL